MSMKVIGYAGSNSAFSKSICMGEMLKTILKEQRVEIELYTARNDKIQECIGCGKCFEEGTCPQDQWDSMQYIRKKLLEADLVILFSPVYLNNVSGAMKTFLDRIGSWVHTFALSGKLGIIVTVTDQSGQEFVSYYLQKILLQMGCNVIGEYKVVALEEQNPEKIVEKIASDILKSISNQEQYKSTDELETIFQHTKERFVGPELEQYKEDAYEVRYWYESGMAECESFQDVLNLRKSQCGSDMCEV